MAGESAWPISRTMDVIAKYGSRLMQASLPCRRKVRPLPSWRDRYGRGSESPTFWRAGWQGDQEVSGGRGSECPTFWRRWQGGQEVPGGRGSECPTFWRAGWQGAFLHITP